SFPLFGLPAASCLARRLRSVSLRNLASQRQTVVTNVACDQVSGETESGAPVKGSTCSASTPDGDAWSATQRSIRIGSSRSRADAACAIFHCAIQSVQ